MRSCLYQIGSGWLSLSCLWIWTWNQWTCY